MKYSYFLFIFCLIFFGGACRKQDIPARQGAQNPADCEQAEYRFACYLDRAMAAQDPELCHDAGEMQRATCLSAYEEITETEVDCTRLSDAAFQFECEQNHLMVKQNQAESAEKDIPSPTSTPDTEE